MKNLNVPIAIIIAGVIVAGAIIFSSGGGGVGGDEVNNPVVNNQKQPEVADNDFNFDEITESDHIRGNKEARIKIVEYSDIECPFCAQFHATMSQIVEKYNGQVAWVYRHFPLTSIHPGAFRKAESSECVAELGDNEKFWEYVDILFDEQTGITGLAAAAERVGVDKADFNECMSEERHKDIVQRDLDGAIASGGRGTPHSIIVLDGEAVFPVNGAVPIGTLEELIDGVLEQI